MKYRTIFEPTARAELRRLDRRIAMQILHKLAELEADPLGCATTELVTAPGIRRLRVGDYRVAYKIVKNQVVILVVAVAHRSEIYER